MVEYPDFADFLRRIRAGDDAAAVELVRRFEPLIRREVRIRMGDDRLNRAFDSLDVCQSVFANFFRRAASGEFVIERPTQLVGLLVSMARNRLVSRVRHERQLVRDVGRVAGEPGALDCVADAWPSPSEIVSRKEEMELVKTSLSDEEHQIFELRKAGHSWDEIATRMGGSSQSRRMQWARSLDRLERGLGRAK
jgi:RNA polymerase sigma factor (sigma-70 family)